VVTSGDPITPDNFDQTSPVSGAPAPASTGTAQFVTVPSDAQRYVGIRAVDAAGNLGPVQDFDRGPGAGGGGGGGTGGSGGGSSGSGGVAGATGNGGPTGERAAALHKCRKVPSKTARRKCRSRAHRLLL